MRSMLIAVVLASAGYVGVMSAESVQLPPARVVDAVADTSNLAIGTAAYFENSGSNPGRTSVASSQPRAPELTTTIPAEDTPSGSETSLTSPNGFASGQQPVAEQQPTSVPHVATTPPPPTARDRGEAALDSFSYEWRSGLPGWEISFHPGRKGVLGYTFVQERKIEIYVRDDMSDPLLAHVIAHEIGHAIDVSMNSGDERRRWQAARGIEDKPWWPGNGATDFSTGAGDFAESFAAWQVGNASFRSSLGPAPNESQKLLLAELVGQR